MRRILCCWLALAGSQAALSSETPFERHGALSVRGRRLVSEKTGAPVVLRGLSSHGLQWHGWGRDLTPSTLRDIAVRWRADVLRLAVYADEGGYNKDPESALQGLDAAIRAASDLGLYCVVDWHILDPGDPNRNLDSAISFFREATTRHQGRDNLLFEICNEPNGTEATWASIKSYAAAVIPVIRERSPNSVILLGTPAWSSFGVSSGMAPAELINHPLGGALARNVMYTFHFYAASHREAHRRAFEDVASVLPVFVSEWGAQAYTGDGPTDIDQTRRWLDLMARLGVSWCYWNYSDDPRSGAVWKPGAIEGGRLRESDLKPSGRFLLEELRRGSGG